MTKRTVRTFCATFPGAQDKYVSAPPKKVLGHAAASQAEDLPLNISDSGRYWSRTGADWTSSWTRLPERSVALENQAIITLADRQCRTIIDTSSFLWFAA